MTRLGCYTILVSMHPSLHLRECVLTNPSLHLPVCYSRLSQFQKGPHYSVTYAEFEAMKKLLAYNCRVRVPIRVYPCTESFEGEEGQDPPPFVRVWNQYTKEWNDRGFLPYLSKLSWNQTKALAPKAPKPNKLAYSSNSYMDRGNVQISCGWACELANMRRAGGPLDLGRSAPVLTTMTESMKSDFAPLSSLSELLDMPWADLDARQRSIYLQYHHERFPGNPRFFPPELNNNVTAFNKTRLHVAEENPIFDAADSVPGMPALMEAEPEPVLFLPHEKKSLDGFPLSLDDVFPSTLDKKLSSLMLDPTPGTHTYNKAVSDLFNSVYVPSDARLIVHMDTKNPRYPFSDDSVLPRSFSDILVISAPVREGRNIYRDSYVVCGRHNTLSFAHKICNDSPQFANIVQNFHKLPPGLKDLSVYRDVLGDRGLFLFYDTQTGRVLDAGVRTTPSINKYTTFASGLAYRLSRLRQRDGSLLTIRQASELLYVIVISCTVVPMAAMLSELLLAGSVPDDPFWFFINWCKEHLGGCMKAPFHRFNPSANRPCPSERLEQIGLQATVEVVAQAMAAPDSYKTPQWRYESLYKDVFKNIHYAGSLTGQHFIMLLVLSGICPDTELLRQAVYSDKSALYKDKEKRAPQDKKEMLEALAAFLDIDLNKAESAGCELNRDTADKVCDVLHAGCPLITLDVNNNLVMLCPKTFDAYPFSPTHLMLDTQPRTDISTRPSEFTVTCSLDDQRQAAERYRFLSIPNPNDHDTATANEIARYNKLRDAIIHFEPNPTAETHRELLMRIGSEASYFIKRVTTKGKKRLSNTTVYKYGDGGDIAKEIRYVTFTEEATSVTHQEKPPPGQNNKTNTNNTTNDKSKSKTTTTNNSTTEPITTNEIPVLPPTILAIARQSPNVPSEKSQGRSNGLVPPPSFAQIGPNWCNSVSTLEQKTEAGEVLKVGTLKLEPTQVIDNILHKGKSKRDKVKFTLKSVKTIKVKVSKSSSNSTNDNHDPYISSCRQFGLVYCTPGVNEVVDHVSSLFGGYVVRCQDNGIKQIVHKTVKASRRSFLMLAFLSLACADDKAACNIVRAKLKKDGLKLSNISSDFYIPLEQQGFKDPKPLCYLVCSGGICWVTIRGMNDDLRPIYFCRLPGGTPVRVPEQPKRPLQESIFQLEEPAQPKPNKKKARKLGATEAKLAAKPNSSEQPQTELMTAADLANCIPDDLLSGMALPDELTDVSDSYWDASKGNDMDQVGQI